MCAGTMWARATDGRGHWRWARPLLALLVLALSGGSSSLFHEEDALVASTAPLTVVDHPLSQQLLSLVRSCAETPFECDQDYSELIRVGAKLANEHAILLLHDRAKGLFDDVVYFLGDSFAVSSRLAHMGAVLSFAQGNVAGAQMFHRHFDLSDLVVLRAAAAQALIVGNDAQALSLMARYSLLLEVRFRGIMLDQVNQSVAVAKYSPMDAADQDEFLLSLVLSEAQGGVRTLVKVTDLTMMQFDGLRPLDEPFRFRLGVGLTKLGLYDLSLRHVGLAATPWESPLFRLRAKLVFSPVHSSIGALATAVNNFERQIETILLRPPLQNAQMVAICSSLNEAALALQALPLLHVVGFSSPVGRSSLGHLPVSLPVLLGEVYQRLCPVAPHGLPTIRHAAKKITIGVMAGSLDGVAGKIMIGMLDGLTERQRRGFEFVALCFPTARSAVTDRLMALFASHVNLVPENKTLSLNRIKAKDLDIIIFADASSDARVFALAHERLAAFQAVLWGWGGTLGIPTVDHYLVPDMFLEASRCSLLRGEVAPAEIFKEQVVLLEGLPSLPTTLKLVTEDLWQIMRTRYLLELGNRTHIYLVPASVKFLHPQFDRALEVILATDPIAVVVAAVVRTGRDSLPTTHIAVRHDLLHPAMPPAAVAQFMDRMRARLGDEVRRVRFLPPLEEPVFRALQVQSVAVLDPFPVGLHEPILEAMLDRVPVVTAPELQECTNSHAVSLGRQLRIPAFIKDLNPVAPKTKHGAPPEDHHFYDIPVTPEDYGVLAVRMSKETPLRAAFTMRADYRPAAQPSHAAQLLDFVRRTVAPTTAEA